jgi:hypothetical protein
VHLRCAGFKREWEGDADSNEGMNETAIMKE